MGYRPPPVADVSYTVTVSNELVLVNDSVNLDIDLSHGETHLFSQTDTSNKNKLFAFTRWSAPQSPYTDGLVLMGEPGRPDSYLYYDASGNVGDLVYDLQTISGDDYTLRYPIATTSTDVIMPYGSDLSFVLTNNATTPLTYEISGSYFDLSDVSNGTIAAGNTLTFSKTLNAYGKIRLFFNGKNYFRRFVPYQNYAVTVSGDTFYIDGAEAPKLYNQQDGLYMFDQTHSSNLGKPLTFTTSATDDGTATAYTVGVETIGTPGYANAYTLLDRNKGAGSLYYYNADVSGMGNVFDNVTPDQTYSVKTVVNSVGNTVFTISSDGTNYYAQEDISLNPGELYYFDTSDASISGHTLTFGTGVDDSVIPSEYIVRSIAAPGTTGANLYLDLRNYLFPMVDVRDVSYGVFTQAYGGVPFTVTFASGLTDGSFSLVDANGAAVALTSPSATDVSYGLSTVDITIGANVSSGTLRLGGTANPTTVDIVYNSQVNLGENNLQEYDAEETQRTYSDFRRRTDDIWPNKYSKLTENGYHPYRGTVAEFADENFWVQINTTTSNTAINVYGVITMGSGRGYARYATKVKIKYSIDGNNFYYVDNGVTFTANHNPNDKKYIMFSSPVSAKYIRIYPIEGKDGWAVLRAALII